MRTPFSLASFILIFTIALIQPGWSDRRIDDEFWSTADEQRAQDEKKWAGTEGTSPMRYSDDYSSLKAGLSFYSNYGVGEDDNTVGLYINGRVKDILPYVGARVDAFLGLSGPAEGMLQADVQLIRGLYAGLGISYTNRLKFSPRFQLAVEDKTNPARYAGLFLLRDSGGGIELGWPIAELWSLRGEFGTEKRDNESYRRILVGLIYHL